MKRQVIIVMTGKSPLDILAEMGRNARKAWIYFDNTCKHYLEKEANSKMWKWGSLNLDWVETEKIPATSIKLQKCVSGLYELIEVDSGYIEFTRPPYNDPEGIFFFTMQK